MRTELDMAARPAAPLARLLDLPLPALVGLAVAVLGVVNLMPQPDRLAGSLGDTDDATRLVIVRELMAGASWFDTTLSRFGGAADVLVTHWSRLIDLPLALLMHLLGPIVGVAQAEFVTRALWPLMVLIPLVYLLAREAETRAGRLGALLAIGFALTAMSGLVQFLPGRIDHHNVQILGAVGGALLLTRSLVVPALALPAGVLLGLGTAVGYEALLLTSATLALAALMACWSGRGLMAMAQAVVAFAGTLWLAFLATTPPERWLEVHCDALSLNLLMLATASAAGLLVTALHPLPRNMRLATLLGSGALGLAMFATSAPACLRGPFGQVDPAILPIWLDSVVETHSLLRQARTHGLIAVVWLLFAAVGLIAAARSLAVRTRDEDRLLAVVVALAVVLSCWQLKLIPYATFLLVPMLAVMVARIGATRDVSAPVLRCAAFMLLNQTAVTVAAVMVMSAIGFAPTTAGSAARSAAPCLATRAVSALDALPRGRFAGDIDLGPFIVALTHHDVLAAPYHRLGSAIVANHDIMTGSEERAKRLLAWAGVDYVAVCPGLQLRGDTAAGLRAALLAGMAPAWLQRVELDNAAPLSVWRVRTETPR